MADRSITKHTSTVELLKAQTHVWNHMFTFINSMSLNCAIRLNIPDVINKHGQPINISQLAEALSIDKGKVTCLHRLMRVLVHSGFFVTTKDENEEQCYTLTLSSKLLLEDEPFSIRPLFLTVLDPAFVNPWHFFSQWFRDDGSTSTPFETCHGKAFWDYAIQNAEFSDLFYNCMATDSVLMANLLTKEHKEVFEGIDFLVDVGGNTGTLAMGIADGFPNMSCIVFDLPHVVDKLEGTKNNLTFVGGDMFEAIPHADAVLLKWILHDWSDEDCVNILKRCKEAIPEKEKGGKVIIIDIVVDSQKGDYKAAETQLFWDMSMMINCTGKERTEEEWAELFKAAGFSDYKITASLGLRSLIQVFP